MKTPQGNNTAEPVQKLHTLNNCLAIICNVFCIRHQKRIITEKNGLPFIICTSDGYIIDIPGPLLATKNDAKILEHSFVINWNGLSTILKEGDIFIFDKCFRNVVYTLKEKRFGVLMPPL